MPSKDVMHMTLKGNIKSRRMELGLTLEDVAKVVGVTRATIQKYENGIISNVPSDKIELLARALQTTPAFLMGWEDSAPAPNVTDDVVTFPILGDVAAGYDHVAYEDWDFANVDIPRRFLHGRSPDNFFVLRVVGDSMYPLYLDGDLVLVLKQTTMNRSGEIGVVMYDDDKATLKKVEYAMGEDWMTLTPINAMYPPVRVRGEELEHCRVLGIPQVLIRRIKD